MTPHRSFQRHLRRLEHLVARHGCAVQFVADPDGPSWAYTIGLEAVDHPEVVVMGCDAASASTLCRALWYAAISESTPAPGRTSELELAGVRCSMLDVHPDHLGSDSDLVLGARRYWEYHGREGLDRARQLVWSDPWGHLPWEAGFDPRFERFQPLLDLRHVDPHRWPGMLPTR